MQLQHFIGASYVSTAQEVDVEDCKNLYPEIQQSPGAKAAMVLYGSPGTGLYYDFADGGPIRGELEVEGVSYFVSGSTVYQQDAFGVVRVCDTGSIATGTIGNDNKPVRFAANATQILIVSAGLAYALVDRALSAIASPPWTFAVDCAYLDGFFIVLDDDGGNAGGVFFITPDIFTWDPLDFSNAPASNNKLRALAVDHGELWIFGTIVTQVFYNNQNADFPFVPNLSGIIMQGTVSRDSIQQIDNTLIWVGRNKDGVLEGFVADGYTAKSITPPPIAQQWQRYSDATDAVAWTFQIDSHANYHVNFLSAGKSWRYDRATGLWHRVSYRNPITGQDECHRGNNHIVRNGVHLIGDRQNGKVWKLSPTLYTDGDVPMVSSRRSPAQNQENKIIFYPIFELITPAGIGDGTVGTPEENPEWMLRWSNDNGHNWSNEFLLAAGKVGEYGTRLRKTGCGSARNRVWEVSFSANRPRCLIGAEIPGAYVGTS